MQVPVNGCRRRFVSVQGQNHNGTYGASRTYTIEVFVLTMF
ncbi:unnamed protein product [Haemonchus placei]|uniref:DUF4278 domain-containing protein n=1 Tax=Haemonchus placei TaxID=6290 RepID=A0A0N4X4C6_HAEPC|nr:unnamed protein product [Haemonchus placei]